MYATKIHYYTVAEYLALENDGEQRHEYVNGELFAMVGASRAHNRLATHLTMALGTHLWDTPNTLRYSELRA